MDFIPKAVRSLDRRRQQTLLLTAHIVVALAALIAVSLLAYNHIQYQAGTVVATKARLQDVTGKACAEIERTLADTMLVADRLSAELSSGRMSVDQVLAELRKAVAANPSFYGGTVTFRPYGYKPDRRLFAPYYSKSGPDGVIKKVMIEDVYDYTAPGHDWYLLPMEQGHCWVEPYWGAAGKTFMTTYSAVFYDNDPVTGGRRPLGVVSVDVSMAQIKKIVESLNLGPSGFGALVSKQGVYLYHPNKAYVVAHKNVMEVAREQNDRDRLVMAAKVAQGESGILKHVSTTTGQEAWLVFAPVPLTGWSLQNTFLKSDIPLNVDVLRHQLQMITLAGLIFVLAVLGLLLRVYKGGSAAIWAMSSLSAFAIALGVGLVWGIALKYNPTARIEGVRVSDKATLCKIMNDYRNRAAQQHLEAPIYVPTGVFIEAVKLTGPGDVFLTGYVWQKYDDSFPDELAKEFMISKATSVSIHEVDRQRRNGTEVIRWYFEADVRQQFNHRQYPLEQERLGMRLVNKQLHHNVVLVPDLDAYPISSSSLLPGLDKGVFVSGWRLLSSYFELRSRPLNATFGLEQAVETENYPVLYFNIGMQRNFVDAFISNLTPLILVAIMLFFLLLLSNRIDGARVFSLCVAMFFVIVFSHIDIRRKISAQEIFYLEYFYFLTYGAILFVALNAISYMLAGDSAVDGHHRNLLPRAIFWPLIMAVIMVVTLQIFY